MLVLDPDVGRYLAANQEQQKQLEKIRDVGVYTGVAGDVTGNLNFDDCRLRTHAAFPQAVPNYSALRRPGTACSSFFAFTRPMM